MKPHHPFIGGELLLSCVSEVSTEALTHTVSIEMRGPATGDGRSSVSAINVRNGRTENSKEIER